MSTIKLFWHDSVIKASLIISTILFVIFIIIGMMIPLEISETITNNQYTFSEIFKNNIREVGFSLVKILSFGLFNVIDLLINGILLGVTINFSFTEFGLYTMFTRLFIHGFWEIPVIIITNSLGFIPLLLLKQRKYKHYHFYLQYLFTSMLICSILTLIAALIESIII